MKAILMLLLAATSSVAVELPAELVVDGSTYEGVVYQRHDEAFVFIMHDAGTARLKIEALPVPIQAALGYDVSAAASRMEADRKAQTEAAMKIAEQQQRAAAAKANAEREKNEAKEIRVKVIQVVDGGVLADQMRSYAIASSSARLGMGGSVVEGWETSGKTIFVSGLKDLAEDEARTIIAMPDGTFEYTDTLGAERTVRQWKFLRLPATPAK